MFKNNLRELTSDSFVYGLTGLLSRSIGFLLIPVYTRMLSPEDYGVMSVVGTTAQIISIILMLGLPGAVQRFYFDHDARQNRRFLGSIVLFQNGLGLAACLAIIAFAPQISGAIYKRTDFALFLTLSMIQVWLTLVSMAPGILMVNRRQKWLNLAITGSGTLISAAVPLYLVLVKKMGVSGVFLGSVYAQALLWLVYGWLTLKEMDWVIEWRYVKTALAFSLPLVPHLLSHWVLNFIDRIMLQRMAGLEQTGLYSLGYNFGLIMMLAVGSVNTAYAPWFYRQNNQDQEVAIKLVGRMITYYLLAIGLLFLGVASFSREAIELVADIRFFRAYPVVPVVALGYVFQGLYFMAVAPLFHFKKTAWLPFLSIAAALVNIVLNLWLIPRWGMMGAAWATVGGLAVLFCGVGYVSSRLYPVKLEWRRIAIIILAAGITFLLLWPLNNYRLLVSIPLKVLAFLAVPVVMWMAGFFSSDEKEWIKTKIKT